MKATLGKRMLLLSIIMFIGAYGVFMAYSSTVENMDTRSAYFKAQIESDTISQELKLCYYDSLLYRCPEKRPQLLLGKAKVLRDMNGLNYAREALQVYEDMSKMTGIYPLADQLETQYTIGLLYLQLGDPVNALKQAGKLFSYPMPDSLKYYRGKAYLSLANIFMYLEDDDKVEKIIEQGLDFIDSERDHMPKDIYSMLKGGILARKASLMIVKDNFSEAFELFSEAKRLYPDMADRINVNIGGLFSTQQQHDLGNRYYEEALVSSSNPEIKAVAVFNMALSKCQTGKYDEFFSIIKKYEDELKYFDDKIQGATLWALKSEAYESMGNYEEALYARRMADSIKNEIMSPDKIRELEREYLRITLTEKDRAFAEAMKRSDKKDVILWVAIISVFVVAGVCIILYLKLRKRQNSALLRRQERQEEQAYFRKHKEELEATLELRNQEMASMAMKLASVSEKMEEVKDIVADPKARKADIVATVQSMLRELSSDGEVWDAFMGYFEGVNQSFFDRLHRLHPDLTNAETRMCAFILLNRTNKEIAAIINRSARTVETIKYNLRKKMGITESTESYLRSVSSGEK